MTTPNLVNDETDGEDKLFEQIEEVVESTGLAELEMQTSALQNGSYQVFILASRRGDGGKLVTTRQPVVTVHAPPLTKQGSPLYQAESVALMIAAAPATLLDLLENIVAQELLLAAYEARLKMIAMAAEGMEGLDLSAIVDLARAPVEVAEDEL